VSSTRTEFSKFLDDLADNTPNDSQFRYKKKKVNNKKKKKKPVMKEPDTGWSGIV
jgi:hypothetical protein